MLRLASRPRASIVAFTPILGIIKRNGAGLAAARAAEGADDAVAGAAATWTGTTAKGAGALGASVASGRTAASTHRPSTRVRPNICAILGLRHLILTSVGRREIKLRPDRMGFGAFRVPRRWC